jgi:hypothetical protein
MRVNSETHRECFCQTDSFSYQNILLMLNATEDESQLMLAEFEEKNV